MILILLAFVTPSTVLTIEKPPNMVFILADDVGWADTSLVGGYQIPTPNLDALAANGLLLTQHYTMQTCTPSRAALLTGLYPIRMGMQRDVLLPAQPGGMNLSVPTLAERLKDLGYKTHALGKWHLGYSSIDYTPTRRGFDTFFGYYNTAKYYYFPGLNFDNRCGRDYWDDEQLVTDADGVYDTDLITNRAVDIISKHDTDKPLFMYMASLAAHGETMTRTTDAPERNLAKFPYIGDRNRTLLAGGNVSDLGTIDGLDLWPALSTAKSGSTSAWPRSEFLINMDTASGVSGYRDGNHKLLVFTSSTSNHTNPFNDKALQKHFPVPGGMPGFESEAAAEEYLDLLMKSSLAWKTLEELHVEAPGLPGALDGWRVKAAVRCSPQQSGFNPRGEGRYLFDIESDPCELNDLSSTLPSVTDRLSKKLESYTGAVVPPKPLIVDPMGYPSFNDCVWAPWEHAARTTNRSCPCP
ncbi:arylsulfatase B isoform X3 [Rhipicephalus microplus]|uniref:arylsulfatase B isoform X3 n=1 Tax=Rhipicephalus microplus TaxID=6941 RepID=UPI003F6D5E9B